MKKLVIILSFTLFLISFLHALPEGISFTIRFFDKRIYFPDSQILLKADVANNSPESFSFKVSNLRVFNLDFEVKTLTNRELPHAQQFIIQKNSNQPVFVRDLSLEPDEEYSFVIDLREYIDISAPGVYIVKALFYPDLNKGTDPPYLSSNYLNLSIRPPAGVSEIQAQIDEATGEVLQKEALPPDEVVSYTLHSRQKSQWDKFFLYLDLESLLQKNPDRKRKYQKLSDEDRHAMIRSYKNDLRLEKVDNEIIVIPNEFTILKTEYTPEQGTVQVIEKFKYPDYTEIKRYTYYLKRKDRVWYIYDYEIRNVGTE
ncbi:MAG: hypothetical protein AB1798_03960 [Spirochaetota bacterium]